MEIQVGKSGLPENAHRELKPGEEYHPVMPPNMVFPEVTPWSVFWGLFMAMVFSAAAAYSGLKIGQVFEAAIPISIIAVGLASFAKKKNVLGQNVIIQSIGASSGVIVAGAVFTIPALYILKLDVQFYQIFFSSLLGGFLGILFLIPFRKYFVKDMHGKFPFPEATATTEILVTGEKGGNQAGILITSGLVGGLFDFMFSTLRLWEEVFSSRVVAAGEYLAEKVKLVFQFNISAMIVAFGYLVGLKFSTTITVGSLLSWWVLIPMVSYIGGVAAGDGANIFAGMSPEQIFRDYVRHIGIGAIAMAGINGILKSSKIIGSAFVLAYNGITGKSKNEPSEDIRTQRDIKMTFVVMLSLLTIIAIFIFLATGLNITLSQAIVALVTVVIIAFLFTTVAANAIAIVGTNPVSGMTLMTLILSSIVLAQVGLTGKQGMLSALIIGGIVCTALSMAGGFITDLKIGYWLGSTPKKQQSWKFLGTLVSAATVGLVIFMLNSSYGFTADDYLINQDKFTKDQIEALHNNTATPDLLAKYKEEVQKADPLVAPQANAMAAVIQSLMSPNPDIKWTLYLVGAIISILMNMIGISPLAFALGMFIPQQLNTPLIVGGFLSYLVSRSSQDKELVTARHQRATLIASGFIAGAALFGVFGALLKFAKIDLSMDLWANGSKGGEWLALVMFIVLMLYAAWDTMRAKKEQ